MNALFSFWSYPFIQDDKINLNYTSFVYQWGLSVNLAKKHFDKVKLVTDTKGKQLLVDLLNLPFDEVDTSLDNLNSLNKNLFGYAKLAAMDKQTEPFVYIEYDVFLFNKIDVFPAVLVQSIEGYDSNDLAQTYVDLVNDLSATDYDGTIFLSREENINFGYNLGIVGGTDLQFLKDFCGEAKAICDFINSDYTTISPDLYRLYEQWVFVLCTKHFNKTVTKYIESNNNAATLGFVHLKAKKGNSLINYLVKQKLNTLFPNTYKNINNKLVTGQLNNCLVFNRG